MSYGGEHCLHCGNCYEKLSGESGDQEMNQNGRRRYLIEGLLKERPEYENMQIPSDAGEAENAAQIAYEYKNAGGN